MDTLALKLKTSVSSAEESDNKESHNHMYHLPRTELEADYFIASGGNDSF